MQVCDDSRHANCVVVVAVVATKTDARRMLRNDSCAAGADVTVAAMVVRCSCHRVRMVVCAAAESEDEMISPCQDANATVWRVAIQLVAVVVLRQPRVAVVDARV